MLDSLQDLLQQHSKVLLLTHENPDADALGSTLGLAHYLHFLGASVQIRVTPEVPPFLAFLDSQQWLNVYNPERDADLWQWATLIIVLDAGDPSRLAAMQAPFLASSAVKVCLDHHMPTGTTRFTQQFIDSRASATCERVWDLIRNRMPRPWPAAMIQALYAGLVDDTGNFRFPSATPKAHHMAAELIEAGADPAHTYQQLYHQSRPERLKLFGLALSRFRLLGEGRYGALHVTLEDMAACNAIHEDLEGLVNRPLEVKGVEVACLLYELQGGKVKASLRSRHVDVNAVCAQFGGGGHRLASGAKLDGPLPVAQAHMDAAVLSRLERERANPLDAS